MTGAREISVRRAPLRREALRWSLAGATVVTAHVALAYGVATLAPVREPVAITEAMTVELTPLVVSLAEPVEIETVDEERPEVLSELQEDMPAEQEETAETKPEPIEPVEETAEPAEEQPEIAEEEPVEEVAAVPEVKKAEVVMPKPVKPKVQKPKQAKEPEPRKVERKPEPSVKKAVKAPKAVRPSASRKAIAGQAAPRAPKVNPSRWYAQVQSAVARRRPSGLGQSGRVMIRFVVNSVGRVISSGIARSSGHAALDQAALSMARGARVPAPPPGLGRSTFPFTIPVDFR